MRLVRFIAIAALAAWVCSAQAATCSGTTQKGLPCRNRVRAGQSYCYLHVGQGASYAPKAAEPTPATRAPAVAPSAPRPAPTPAARPTPPARRTRWLRIAGDTLRCPHCAVGVKVDSLSDGTNACPHCLRTFEIR